MTKLLVKNAKIAKSSNATHTLYNYGIPAYKSKTGRITCPMAGTCATGCYAQSGAYAWGNVQTAYENRLEAAESDNFPELLQKELAPKIKTAVRQGKQLVIRIHDSGDFYSVKYLNKWLNIIRSNPTVKFYAYTKMVTMFQRLQKTGQIPSNFSVILSEGGLADKLINCQEDRHSRVFPDETSLISAGYDNASKDDTVAFTSLTGKIGLIYHGPKSKSWSTDQ
jgi:hypothetical protein